MRESRLRQVRLGDLVPGALFLCEMPGRCAELSEYEGEMEAKDVSRVLCLTPLEEVRRKSPEYAAKLEEHRFPWPVDFFAIPDHGAPSEGEMVKKAREVAGLLREGKRVVVHCGAGKQRTGMVATAVLMALGLSLDDAEARIQEAGSDAEPEQKKLLRDIRSALG